MTHKIASILLLSSLFGCRSEQSSNLTTHQGEDGSIISVDDESLNQTETLCRRFLSEKYGEQGVTPTITLRIKRPAALEVKDIHIELLRDALVRESHDQTGSFYAERPSVTLYSAPRELFANGQEQEKLFTDNLKAGYYLLSIRGQGLASEQIKVFLQGQDCDVEPVVLDYELKAATDK